MVQKIVIEFADNGVVVKWEDGTKEIFKFDEENKEGLVNLLCAISERLMLDSKYNKERAEISLAHGSRYICNDRKCKICKAGWSLE